MNILIAADLVPTESNKELFKDENFINYLDKDFPYSTRECSALLSRI